MSAISPVVRRLAAALAVGTAVAATCLATGASATSAPVAGALPQNPTNPLAGGPWGVYPGPWDAGLRAAYEAAESSGNAARAHLLAEEALQSRVIWFTQTFAPDKIAGAMAKYVAAVQNGNPDTLVPIAIFRQFPDTEAKRDVPLTAAEQAAYRRWIAAAAKGIGSARALIVLEPDNAEVAPQPNPAAMRVARPATHEALVSYAAKTFSALPDAAVYIDAGDADWLHLKDAVTLLKRSGVRYARGFTLGATHYSSVAGNVAYAAAIAKALARAGLPGKHAVIDTADNGHPFTWAQYAAKHGSSTFINPVTCGSKSQRVCDSLGIAPTWQVVGTPQTAKLHLNAAQRNDAATYVDGYVWVGRPWLHDQSNPFELNRALAVARTTPFDETNTTGG